MSDEDTEALRPPPDEATADAIRAAFRAMRGRMPLSLDRPEGESWFATGIQRVATVPTESRPSFTPEFITNQLGALLREDADAMGAVALDEPPEWTWQPLKADRTPDTWGMLSDPPWWRLTVIQQVAVPEGYPALLLDQEAP